MANCQQELAEVSRPRGAAQLDFFPGTREAASFHAPSHLGFFALNWRNPETIRETNSTMLLLYDLEDYQKGRFRESHALAAGAESVEKRIEQLTAVTAGKSRYPVRQRCYPVSMLSKILDALNGRPGFDQTDFWISQNGFAQRNRRATSVLHLNMLFADLDIRTIGGLDHWLAKLSPEWAAQHLVVWCADEGIPMPSLVIWSGNGLHPKWLFAESAPRAAKPVWDALQLHLVKRLKARGWPVDEQVRDVPRILRIPGSFNPKGGELCRVVWINGPDLEHCQRYDFNELADGKTIMPWSRAEAREYKAVAKIWDENRAIAKSIDTLTRPNVAVGQYLVAELWHNRLSAIRRLVELRWGTAGVPEGQRDSFVWVAANALAWSCGGADKYSADLVPVIKEMAPTLSHADILSSASAITKRVREPEGQDKGLYKVSNDRFRALLGISDAEAVQLFQPHWPPPDCQVGVMEFPQMANLPFTEYLAETKRRQAAAAERTNQVRKSAGRKSRKDELLPQALTMLADGQTQQAIAEALGITPRTLFNWLARHGKGSEKNALHMGDLLAEVA